MWLKPHVFRDFNRPRNAGFYVGGVHRKRSYKLLRTMTGTHLSSFSLGPQVISVATDEGPLGVPMEPMATSHTGPGHKDEAIGTGGL